MGKFGNNARRTTDGIKTRRKVQCVHKLLADTEWSCELGRDSIPESPRTIKERRIIYGAQKERINDPGTVLLL
jgi:hypothetical protein